MATPAGVPVLINTSFNVKGEPIVETPEGLVAAWFGGTGEGKPDVGIWISRRDAARWSPPTQVADGAQADGTRHPCWNPVLFQPSRGPLLLCPQSLFKIHPDNDALFARVLRELPAAWLVCFEGRDRQLSAQYRSRLEAAGIAIRAFGGPQLA